MTEEPELSSAELAARIVDGLLNAGLLDARFEDEAIRVVVAAIEARPETGTGDRTRAREV